MQQVGLSVGSALGILVNPHRADFLATLGEVTGEQALRRLKTHMDNHPTGRQILIEKPLISEKTLPLSELRQLPSHTLGYQYFQWMQRQDFSPDDRPKVRFISDPELAYVMTRYRQIHDFFHVLADLEPTIEGELIVKALETHQIGLPMNALSFFGQWNLNRQQISHLWSVGIPWAKKCSDHLKTNLMNVYYEHHLEEDITHFRESLGFIPFPHHQEFTTGK